MTNQLIQQANDFASRITALVQGCINDAPKFVTVSDSSPTLRIVAEPFTAGTELQKSHSLVPLIRNCDDANDPRLFLKLEFKVSLDRQSEYLAVQRSTFGLWVRFKRKHFEVRPVFRLEYDRDAHSKPEAHIHIHAESAELGWIYGTQGLALPYLHAIHFPVGGRRFRPTVEDFFRFLDREKLFTDWKPGWDKIVDASLDEWHARQTRAAVRNDPQSAIQQLSAMGYKLVFDSKETVGQS